MAGELRGSLQRDEKLDHPRAGAAKQAADAKRFTMLAIKHQILASAPGREAWLTSVARDVGEAEARAVAAHFGIAVPDDPILIQLGQASVSIGDAHRASARLDDDDRPDYMDDAEYVSLYVIQNVRDEAVLQKVRDRIDAEYRARKGATTTSQRSMPGGHIYNADRMPVPTLGGTRP